MGVQGMQLPPPSGELEYQAKPSVYRVYYGLEACSMNKSQIKSFDSALKQCLT